MFRVMAQLLLLSIGVTSRRYAVNEVPAEWQKFGMVSDNQTIVFRVALPQRHLSRLQVEFEAISDPSSQRYGQHLTREQVRAIVSPPQEDSAIVQSWLFEGGVDTIDDLGDALRVRASAAVVAKLLQTTLAQHKHALSGHVAVHMVSDYHIPDEAAKFVEFASGLTAHRLRLPAPPVGLGQNDTDHTYMIPAMLRALYSVDAKFVRASSLSTQGFAAFNGKEKYSAKDLADWYTILGEQPTEVTAKGMTGLKPTPESTLDVQYLTTIGSGAPTQFLVVSGDFYDHAVELVNDENRPLVNSISWGVADEHQYGASKIQRTDAEYMKLGSMGASVFAASGDQGAEGMMGCNDFDEYPLLGGGYPASSPYVTSVGATQTDVSKPPSSSQPPLPDVCNDYPCTSARPEIACSAKTESLITSGGGFAFLNKRPSYQEDAVAGYLSGGLPLPESCGMLEEKPVFHKENRGYPDISANGNYYLIKYAYKGKPYASTAGTSASTPTVAGMVSLLNSLRLKAGQPSLGFINPLLYKMAAESPDTLNDITEGDNFSTQGGFNCKCGYYATKGWDPVTGLGTMNFANIVKYLGLDESESSLWI